MFTENVDLDGFPGDRLVSDARFEDLQRPAVLVLRGEAVERFAPLLEHGGIGIERVGIGRHFEDLSRAQQDPGPGRGSSFDLFAALNNVVNDVILPIPEADRVAGPEILQCWLAQRGGRRLLAEDATRAPKHVHSPRSSEDANCDHDDEDDDHEQDEGSERIKQTATVSHHLNDRR